MDIKFDDGTIAKDCFVKVAKVIGGGTISDILRINYYPSNYNIAPNTHDVGTEKIKAKLLADDIISITLKQDNNSYTFPMQEILTSLTLKNLYDHVPHDDAPVTDPVMGILSQMITQTETKPTEQKSQAKSTTQDAETSRTTTKSTGGILSNFNKLAKKGSVPAIDLVQKKCGLYDSNISWEDAKANLMNSNYNATIDEIGINFTCPFSYNGIVPTCMVLSNFTNTTFRFTVNDNDAQRNLARKLTEDMKAGGATIDYTIDTPEKAFRTYGNYGKKTISITTNKTGVLVDIF